MSIVSMESGFFASQATAARDFMALVLRIGPPDYGAPPGRAMRRIGLLRAPRI
jgi:hypothetical protein